MHPIYKILASVILVVGLIETSVSQNQPHLLDLRSCEKSCTAKNYSILDVFLSDINGNPMTSSLLTCTPDFEQTTYLSIRYQTSSNSNVNNARIFADLKVGEETQYMNYFIGLLPSAQSNPKVLTLNNFPLNWTCGVEVILNNPLLTWTTSASSDLSQAYECNNYPSGQCQYQSNIVVNAPLAVQFDYSYSCPSNGETPVAFTSTTNGGRGPYLYSWSFTNAGTSSSNVADPIVDYYRPGAATLTVTDANGTANTYHADIDIPTEFDFTPAIIHQTEEDTPNGSIIIEMDESDEFNFSWSGPNGFVGDEKGIYGLSEGTYMLTITDSFGCSETFDFEIFYFITLSLLRDDLKASLKGDNQAVQLNWSSKLPIGTGHFEVERSVGDISRFIVVGKLPITDWETKDFNYDFTDGTLPKNHGWIYYRIKFIPNVGQPIYTLTIKVEIPLAQSEKKWSAFPNPFENNLQLKYLGNPMPHGTLTTIRIYSPNSFFTNQFSTNESFVDLGTIIESAPKGLLILEIKYMEKVEIVKVIKK